MVCISMTGNGKIDTAFVKILANLLLLKFLRKKVVLIFKFAGVCFAFIHT